MGQTLQLAADDGHRFDVYRADPATTPLGGVIVVQEAFGVNEHIRAVCDRYAEHGYVAMAPALYDRQQRNATFGYDEAQSTAARALRARIDYAAVLRDLAAVIAALRPYGGVGIVGYCVGGSAAWLAACRLRVDAAACYYASDIGKQYQETPRCPVIMHFAERDRLVSAADRDHFQAAQRDVPAFIYAADHGFNNWHRPASYDAASAELALARTLALFAQHVAGRTAASRPA
jgi:carboxymethylenebutenolidase